MVTVAGSGGADSQLWADAITALQEAPYQTGPPTPALLTATA